MASGTAAGRLERTGSISGNSIQGWLIKSPPTSIKKWRRRWFSLNKERVKLQYYKDETKVELKGEIDLRQCQRCNFFLHHPRYEWTFSLVTANREYFLAAASEEELSVWVQAVQRAWSGGARAAQPTVGPATTGTSPTRPLQLRRPASPPQGADNDSDDGAADDVFEHTGAAARRPLPAAAVVGAGGSGCDDDDDDDDDAEVHKLIERTVTNSTTTVNRNSIHSLSSVHSSRLERRGSTSSLGSFKFPPPPPGPPPQEQ